MTPPHLGVCETFLLVCCLCGPSTISADRVQDVGLLENVLDVEAPESQSSVSPTCLPKLGSAERKFIDDLKNLTTLPTKEQQDFLIHSRPHMPMSCRTSSMFRWLGQHLMHTQGLTTAAKIHIAEYMNVFGFHDHIEFLRTDPGYYAFFHEVARYCAALALKQPTRDMIFNVLLAYLHLLELVSRQNGTLASKYPHMVFDAAEFFVRLKPIMGGMPRSRFLQPVVTHHLQQFVRLKDAVDWYVKFLYSYESPTLERIVTRLLWSRLTVIVPDPDELLMMLRQGGFFYTKLPFSSFYHLLRSIFRDLHHQDPGAQVLQDLVRLIRRHSGEGVPEDEIDHLRACAKILSIPCSNHESFLTSCRTALNRSTAFALTAEVGLLGQLAVDLPDAEQKLALASQILDAAGELREAFDGLPASIMISNVWRIVAEIDDGKNASMNVLTNHSHLIHRIMDGLNQSKHDRFYEAYFGAFCNACKTNPGALMREVPDAFERMVETISPQHLTRTKGRSGESECIMSLATQLPCQVLDAYPSAAMALLELMRGHVNESCTDNTGFVDSVGYTCQDWESFAFSCKEQALHEKYKDKDAEAIVSNCKASCKSCITEAIPKFSMEQAGLGQAFRQLTACKSRSFFKELDFILANAKSFGDATTEVLKSVSEVLARDPSRFLKTGIMRRLHSLAQERWTDVINKEDARKWILESVNVLIKEAEAVSRALENQNANLSAMKDDVTNKNSRLEDMTQSLSYEKEVLRRIARSQERIATLSQHFSEQARRQVPCQNQFCTIPSGWTVVTSNDSYDLANDDVDDFVSKHQLYRCPNRDACPGDRNWPTSSNSSFEQCMCANGYRGGSHGCARCEEDHGRAQFDPFLCRACAPLGLASAQYVLPPVVIYATGLAFANAEPTTAGSLLNVLLSFSLTAHCILTPIASTRLYHEVKANVSSFIIQLLELPEAGAETVGFGYMSYDCMQQQLSLSDHVDRETDFIWIWLAFDACIPSALLFSSLVLNVIIRMFKPDMSLTRVLVLPMLVFGNSFLPKLFGASLRSFPCVLETLGPDQTMAYALDMPCSLRNTLPMGAVCGIICCCVGPVFWAIMFRRSHTWTQACKKETLGYLSVDYREEYQWWEVLVLLRKMSLAAVNTLWPASYAPSSHSLFCHLVVGIALILHCLHYPYKSNFLNRVEIGALLSAFVAMTGAQYVTVEEDWTHTEVDSLLLILFTYITLIVTFLILVGLWICTSLTEMGVLRGFGPEAASPKEQES
eukprot:TRINITY_DN73965_c0_g1_i1.p1 TRINITY_DN73965_c0_g1~~TRINITY_DN73965_c0_g1_i1.p1  ORF type:complete len:1256 (-),score=171.48 TRINITY_DN73965_c0_g1_i1:170-3937(-)